MATKSFCYVSNCRLLLSDRNVDTDHVVVLLVDDRIDRNRRLTSLTVTDDKLPLTTADRDHRVDRLDTCLHRLMNRFTVHNAWCRGLNWAVFLRIDRAFTVDRLSERVHDTAEQGFTDWYLHDASRTLNLVTFVDAGIWTKNDDPD